MIEFSSYVLMKTGSSVNFIETSGFARQKPQCIKYILGNTVRYVENRIVQSIGVEFRG